MDPRMHVDTSSGGKSLINEFNCLANLLRNLISQFPKSISPIDEKHDSNNQIVEKLMLDKIHEWDLGLPSNIHERYFIYGLSIATTAYHHVHSLELQAEIALFTGLAILIDDGVMGIPALQEFIPRLCTGLPQLHPSLDRMTETVRDLGNHFTQYGANAIYVSTIDYLNSELFERESKNDVTLGPDSIPYAKYMRGKDGYVEAYTAFVWPKDQFPDTKEYIQAFPDTMEYLTLVNDIFSYYKEARAGETGTYVLNLADANQKDADETIAELIDYTVALVHRIRGVLGMGKARDAWESFAAGYIRYHLQTERYRLTEILPELLS